MPKTRRFVPNIEIRATGFTMPSGGSFPRNFTITGPAVGLVPKAVIIQLTNATVVDSITAGAQFSVGITDGTTQRAIGFVAENGAIGSVNANSAYRVDTASVIQLPTSAGGGALEVSASFVSFGTDSVTINVDTGKTYIGTCTFFYGSDLRANVTSFASSASIGGTAATTAPGWKPDAVLAWTCGQAFTSLGSGSGGMLSHGFAGRIPSLLQSCSAVVSENAAITTTSSGCLTRNDCFLTQLSSSAGTVTEGTRLEFTSFDTNGYTITTRNAAVAMEFMGLALDLGGSQTWAGVQTIASSTIGTKANTAPGFKPHALFASACVVATVNTVVSTRGTLSMGMTTVDSAALASVFAQDAQTTSVTGCVESLTNFIDTPLTASTHDWIANLVSFDVTGWTLNVSDASAADRPTAFFAVEQPLQFANAAISETVSISETSLFVESSLQLGETITISEAQQLVSSTLQLGETVAISETFPLVISTLQVGETVTISESAQLTIATLQVSETVSISETSTLLFAALLAGETVSISESSSLIFSSLQASETVSITDGFLFVTTSLQVSETVTISEASSFVVTSDVLRANETVSISETSALITTSSFIANETVAISETVVFMLATPASAIVANETVTLSETSVIQTALEADETVNIIEDFLFVGTGVAVSIAETVTIGEGVVMIVPIVLRGNETVTIGDGFSFGVGAVRMKASYKGQTVEGSS